MKKLVALIVTLVMLVSLCMMGIAEEKQVLRIASQTAEGEPYSIWMKRMAEEFEQETGIEVAVDFAGRDVLNKYKSAILIGDTPDIIEQSFENIYSAMLADEVLLQPLTSFLYDTEGPEGENRMIDIFSEDALKMYNLKDDDNIYMVPFKCNTSGFFYNTLIFDKYGIKAPSTWDELIAVCDTLKQNGVAAFADDGNIHYYNYYYFYWLCERILGTGKLRAAAEDSTGEAFRDPGFLQAAQMVSQLVSGKYFAEGYEGSAYPASQSDWAMGNSAMLLMGSWIVAEVKPLVDPATFNYGYFPFPTVDGGKGDANGVEISYSGYAIPKGGNYELATQFLRFIMKADNMKAMCDQTSSIPARKNVEFPEVIHMLQDTMNGATSYHKVYDATSQFDAEWVANVLYPADDALLFGQITPEQFVEQLVTNTAAFYAK